MKTNNRTNDFTEAEKWAMYSNLAALLSGAGVALGITIGLARHWKRAFVIFTSTACIAVIGILFRIKARKEKKE